MIASLATECRRSWSRTSGMSARRRAKMLGHKNYRTTQRYAHIADYALRDAVNLTSRTIVRAGRSGSKAKRTPQGRSTGPR